jgi:tyrosyl-tRNA synthetase
MSQYQSSLLKLLDERGYIHQATDAAGLDALAMREVIPAYIGFDATAPSLHVGSLVQIMMLRRLQQAGHRPIVLMGGGTTKVGDPSGKDESRQLLSHEQIQANIAGIRKVFERFLTFGDGPSDAVMLDNDEWLSSLEYVPFLREVGRHFTINRMLTFDSVKLRLDREQPLTFLEFNYMILQAYDYLELSRRAGCRLQMGGSDQWGNIVNGIELARRVDGVELFGVTTPLITTANGAKMGKTAQGAVWLNAEMCSSYAYWQFWRNTADADVIRFLKLFTDMSLTEIALFERFSGSELNQCKSVLATKATAMLHGEEAAQAAEDTARGVFAAVGAASGGGGAAGASLPVVSATDAGITIMQANVAVGFATSNNDFRRKMDGDGIRVNDKVIKDPYFIVRPGDKFSSGKKNHALVIKAD